jgi:integrase/recombinase XerD
MPWKGSQGTLHSTCCKKAVKELRAWMAEPVPGNSEFLFPTAHGRRMSADAVQYLFAKYTAIARRTCLSLRKKRVSPHVARP